MGAQKNHCLNNKIQLSTHNVDYFVDMTRNRSFLPILTVSTKIYIYILIYKMDYNSAVVKKCINLVLDFDLNTKIATIIKIVSYSLSGRYRL